LCVHMSESLASTYKAPQRQGILILEYHATHSVQWLWSEA
jgi:hypothetical protein